jgi:hypothetical protein
MGQNTNVDPEQRFGRSRLTGGAVCNKEKLPPTLDRGLDSLSN